MSKFYDEIAKYYDNIFPLQQAKLKLLEEQVPYTPSTILDVACATGSYAMELERRGHNVSAIDLDQTMIEMLKQRESNIDAHVMNMLDIKTLHTNFDFIYCLGNSIVHLDNHQEVETFFRQCYEILKPKGRLLFQIINYDRVLDQKIEGLPTLYDEALGLSFERKYSYLHTEHKIAFQSVLKVEGQTFDNCVNLLPIRYEELLSALKQVGFHTIDAYGDFLKTPLDVEQSIPCIILAKK
ncbi:class I SAM-dependent methyltransferase [Vallitaleaceae bacterium 9-2]